MKESEHAARNVDAKAIIEAVLSHVGMRAPSFAKAIGINYQRIFDLQSGRTKKFNPGIVNLIVQRFPEISKTYLYTGEGSLVNEKNVTHKTSDGTPAQLSDVMGMTTKLVDMLAQLGEREAKLHERAVAIMDQERELLEKERLLNEREHDLNKREAELMRIADEAGTKGDNVSLLA
ncbi:MAG: hypothetical protein K2H21_06460 [Muribaculaceae bacterium]|nr:hypothetical protein [Muribaculaceae bacterium]